MAKRIILAGGGHAHLAVLADWAAQPFPGTQRWLVTSARHTAYSGMLPGWMAGLYRADDMLIDLVPLAEKAGAKLVIGNVTEVDPERRTIGLASGETMGFDLLSLAVGGETDVSSLAKLGERLLAVRPLDSFIDRWSAFVSDLGSGAIATVAVVGGGAAGVELALGAAAALGRTAAHARVMLVTPADDFLSGHAPQVRRRAMAELEKRNVAVHSGQATGTADGLLLSDRHFLPADLVIAATGSRAPGWLARSGLACNPTGFVAIGADLRSVSHPAVFAAGDIVDRVDRDLERSGVHAVKAGPILAANLRAATTGAKLSHYNPRRRTLYLLALGDRRAIGSWGRFSATGRWVWQVKDWIDRRFVRHYSTSGGMIGGQHPVAPSSSNDPRSSPEGLTR